MNKKPEIFGFPPLTELEKRSVSLASKKIRRIKSTFNVKEPKIKT
jgi:hypothetical protein